MAVKSGLCATNWTKSSALAVAVPNVAFGTKGDSAAGMGAARRAPAAATSCQAPGMSRVLIAVVSVGAVAALVGCRGTADTDATATQQQLPPRDAARAILAEVDQFNRDFADVPDQASRIVLQPSR